jgi:glycerophosphoryl diester phosphodiesterase
LDALHFGFASVEADVFPVGGELLVGHEIAALNPERTLEKLYLAPLAEHVRQNNGHVYPGTDRFFLLIDIKANPQAAHSNLQALLAKYSEMLTVVQNGHVRRGAVTVVLTGQRPQIKQPDSNPRYVGIDGRLSDLDSTAPVHLMPMISDEWPKHFRWNGDGPMPAEARAQLRAIVKKAHAAGRVVRFWKTAESEAVWRELRMAGVDPINTDHLDRLAKFLKQQ